MTKTREIKELQGTNRTPKGKKSYVPDKIDVKKLDFPPQDPNGRGKYVFDLVKKELSKHNIIADSDIPALEMLANAYQNFWKAEDGIEKTGLIIEHTNKSGATNQTLNPLVDYQMKQWRIIERLSAKFAMTPIDRNKIVLSDTPQNDELQKVLNHLKR